jgi:hypothetical protein
MPTHKQPLSPLSLNQLSELTGVGYRSLKKKLRGLDPEDQDGRTLLYNSIDALGLIYGGDEDEGEEGEGESSGKIDGRYQQARLTKYKADHLAFDLEVKKGAYLPKLDVETWLSNRILGFKARLRTIATTLSPLLVGKTVDEIERLLGQAHDEALTEMAGDDDDKSAEGSDDEDYEEASSASEAEDI